MGWSFEDGYLVNDAMYKAQSPQGPNSNLFAHIIDSIHLSNNYLTNWVGGGQHLTLNHDSKGRNSNDNITATTYSNTLRGEFT